MSAKTPLAYYTYGTFQNGGITIITNTVTREPTLPANYTIQYVRGFSDLSESDAGGVIGAVAAFGFVVLAIIGWMLFRGHDGHEEVQKADHTEGHSLQETSGKH